MSVIIIVTTKTYAIIAADSQRNFWRVKTHNAEKICVLSDNIAAFGCGVEDIVRYFFDRIKQKFINSNNHISFVETVTYISAIQQEIKNNNWFEFCEANIGFCDVSSGFPRLYATKIGGYIHFPSTYLSDKPPEHDINLLILPPIDKHQPAIYAACGWTWEPTYRK